MTNNFRDRKEKKPKESFVLKKFDRLRQRQKPLYTKAYDLMRNTTLVLEETNMNSSNPTVFFASLLQLLQSLPVGT
jgi:hypothetical protein